MDDTTEDPEVDTGLEVARITITKVLTDDDTEVRVEAADEQGETLALIDSLGMLEFAKMAVVEEYLREDEEQP